VGLSENSSKPIFFSKTKFFLVGRNFNNSVSVYQKAIIGQPRVPYFVQEWHIAPYIAKKLGNFVPYLGVRYSDLRQNYKVVLEDESSKIKFKADDNFGVFVGTDFKITDTWKLNLEGRFVDETAMSLGATYKF